MTGPISSIPAPRSINIFLLDGDPNGIRVAQISMSTIQAMAFRRNQLTRAKSTFAEIGRPGVYILLASSDEEPTHKQAYVGESENVRQRLDTHNSSDRGKRGGGFWDDTIVLVSKDENLTKSHARYIEHCMIRDAQRNPIWVLPNRQKPSSDAGRLPLADRAAMDEFVTQARILVGVLGCDLFRVFSGEPIIKMVDSMSKSVSEVTSNEIFSFSGQGYEAKMKLSQSGDYVVLAGSRARVKTTKSIPRGIETLRGTLVKRDILRQDGDLPRLFRGL